MRYVVGYAPNQRGRDALNLAATLARTRGARLDVAVVLPTEGATFYTSTADQARHEDVDLLGDQWLREALASVPDDVQATGQVHTDSSVIQGLLAAAAETSHAEEAAVIVVGASYRGIIGRFTVGSVAAGLLHSAPVPVALAPAGYRGYPAITRITCAVGLRPGADALVDVALDSAKGRGIPLRVISLLALGARDTEAGHALDYAADQHVDSLVRRARAALPEQLAVTGSIGKGQTVEDAAHGMDFEPSEVVIVGSSRLAGPQRLFIGSAANKMLRALPVPMIVVPRDYDPPHPATVT